MATTEAVLATVNQSTWGYAGLAHAAYLSGGPAELIKAVSESAEAVGHARGLVKGAAIAGPSCFVLGIAAALVGVYVYLTYTERKMAYEGAVAQAMAATDAYDTDESGYDEVAI